MFYFGQNAHFIYQSPDARIRTSMSNQTPLAANEPLADKLSRFAKTMTGAKAMVIATLSFLTSLGIFFGLWKSDNLPRLSFAAHRSNERLVWPSNLRYIDMDSLPELTSSDLIVIAWLKGHLEDSAVAQKLYVDLKNAGYKPQLIQELAFIDEMKSKCGQFTLQ